MSFVVVYLFIYFYFFFLLFFLLFVCFDMLKKTYILVFDVFTTICIKSFLFSHSAIYIVFFFVIVALPHYENTPIQIY